MRPGVPAQTNDHAGGAEIVASVELEFSAIDDLTMWVNGVFEGYSYADDFAWHDFGVNPDHPRSPYTTLPLVEGTNHVLIRVRGGRYASGGFFAAVKTLP